MDRTLLERAAGECGIELEYFDTWGNHHRASDEALLSTLEALGLPTASESELAWAVEQRAAEVWQRPFPLTLVVPEAAEALRLHVPADRAGASVKLEFTA